MLRIRQWNIAIGMTCNCCDVHLKNFTFLKKNCRGKDDSLHRRIVQSRIGIEPRVQFIQQGTIDLASLALDDNFTLLVERCVN